MSDHFTQAMLRANKTVIREAKNSKELSDVYRIRRDVFVKEQGFFTRTDRDEVDKKSIHLVAVEGDSVIGAVRITDMGRGRFEGSRLAVLSRKRRGSAGRMLVEKAVELVADMGGVNFDAHIQAPNIEFFLKLGWTQLGASTIYHGKPHTMMSANLEEALVRLVASTTGNSIELARKSELNKVWEKFSGQKIAATGTRSQKTTPLEDAGIVPWRNEKLLLSADGIIEALVERSPYLAGRAASIACLNDIYAMGGKPLALVNVLSVKTGTYFGEIARGMKEEADRYGVPIIGGHFHPDASAYSLSASALGVVEKPILSSAAKPGMALMAIIDRRGKRWDTDILNWDSNKSKSRMKLKKDFKLIVKLGRERLVNAMKDISNAGLIGTTVMMCRASGTGAAIDLGKIIPPKGVRFSEWVRMFMSYGFIVAVKRKNIDKVAGIFSKSGIWVEQIGQITSRKKLTLIKGESALDVRGISL